MSTEKETLQESHDALVRNLEMAAKERDAMAAKLKELEGQAERYKVLLSNSDHTQPMNSRMLAALRRIEQWFGEFPPTGQQWDDGSPKSYFSCYGSGGERDYMRSVACDAIAAAEAQQERILQDMHDAGREVDRVMAEAAPKAVRLTHADIAKALASAGLKPEDYREDGEILPLVIAIESAALRKNGIEVAE